MLRRRPVFIHFLTTEVIAKPYDFAWSAGILPAFVETQCFASLLRARMPALHGVLQLPLLMAFDESLCGYEEFNRRPAL